MCGPPRPPWEVALEELEALRHAHLLEEQRYAEHFDRTSDALRRYLGARFGFVGDGNPYRGYAGAYWAAG